MYMILTLTKGQFPLAHESRAPLCMLGAELGEGQGQQGAIGHRNFAVMEMLRNDGVQLCS